MKWSIASLLFQDFLLQAANFQYRLIFQFRSAAAASLLTNSRNAGGSAAAGDIGSNDIVSSQ